MSMHSTVTAFHCRSCIVTGLRSIITVVFLAFCLMGPSSSARAQTSGYMDVTEAAGVGVTPAGDRADWGHGAAFRDYDNDGDLDLYVVMGTGQANKLFENRGVDGFVDVAELAGVADVANGRAVVWADYDNDGDADLFVSNYLDPNRLFQNNGDGTFTDVAVAAGLDYSGKCHPAAWADYDNDGYVDLFVGNYGTVAQPQPNLLYHNEGDGTFTEVGASAGVADPEKPALACTWIDYDSDNDLDLYIAYDKTRGNVMFRNNGDGTFTDVSAETNTGIAFNAMGIAVADYDHNGHLDMYVTNTPEGNALLHNNGNGTFSRADASLGVQVNRIGWGCAFLDYDNDGFEDLYVMNWKPGDPAPESENVLFRNTGTTFVDVTAATGVGDRNPGYAVTTGDFNNDGYTDIFCNNLNFRSTLYECVPGTNNWLKLKTVGTASNRDGIGARIRVFAGSLVLVKDVRSGSSYLSGLSPEVEFGLGTETLVDRIEVTWPSGIVDEIIGVAPNQTLTIVEGGPSETVTVSLDILPGSCRNPFNLKGQDHPETPKGKDNPNRGGVLPVAIAGGPDLDVQDIDVASLALVGVAPIRSSYQDVTGMAAGPCTCPDGPDGYTDLVLKFSRRELAAAIEGIAAHDERVSLELTGSLEGGEMISGADCVWVRDGGAEPPMPPGPDPDGRGSVRLERAMPNPFNPTTTIRYHLPADAHVQLVIYDAAGRVAEKLVDGPRAAGDHSTQWHAAGLPSGIYFYRLVAGDAVVTRKVILLK